MYQFIPLLAVQSWLWTHGLIAQSVRASGRNLVVVGSNPTRANFQLCMPLYENVKLEFIQKDILSFKMNYISVRTKTFLRLCIKQKV